MDYKLTFDQYQQGLEKGKFLGLKCNGCKAVTFPPMGVCRGCNGTDLEITEMAGKGDPADLYGDPCSAGRHVPPLCGRHGRDRRRGLGHGKCCGHKSG